jgi:hypothetical protein
MLLNRFIAEPMEKFRQGRVSKQVKNKEAYQSLSG